MRFSLTRTAPLWQFAKRRIAWGAKFHVVLFYFHEIHLLLLRQKIPTQNITLRFSPPKGKMRMMHLRFSPGVGKKTGYRSMRVSTPVIARSEEEVDLPWTPVHDLVLAVIKRAFDDIHGRMDGGSGPRQRRLVKRRARRWFRSQRKSEASFLWCCSLLGLSAPIGFGRHVDSHTSYTTNRINAPARERPEKYSARRKISGHDRTPALPLTSCIL
jgi:hypothetical protein